MRKASQKTLKRKADKLWSANVRSKQFCEVCLTEGVHKEGNNPHHIVSRRYLNLRHDLRNGCLLCSYHHTFGRQSAHQDPFWFREWLLKHRKEDFEYLMVRKNALERLDYEVIIANLKNKLGHE